MNNFSDNVDNRNISLKNQINNQLSSSDKIKFAVGYLYLSEFYQIADKFFKTGNFARLFIKRRDGRIIDGFSDIISEIRCEPEEKDDNYYYEELVNLYNKEKKN